MDEGVVTEVLGRLDADEALAAEAEHLVFAALLGQLEQVLEDGVEPEWAPEARADERGPRVFVGSIGVCGFRGVGPAVRMELAPRPGLTLVVGRNGSGKSSFAEALELVLTGENRRWAGGRSRIWKEGWRNLHHAGGVEIEAELVLEQVRGPWKVSRTWAEGATLEQGVSRVRGAGVEPGAAGPGWEEPLAMYRPFLSYEELGSMLEEGPSRLHDALASILGLEDLVLAADALKAARKRMGDAHKATKGRLEELRRALEASDDERAAACAVALKGRKWDLDAVAARTGPAAGSGELESDLGILRALAALAVPAQEQVERLVAEVRDAAAAVAEGAGSDADRARLLAETLEAALRFHDHAGEADCPVCERSGALGSEWAARAQAERERLRQEAARSVAAHQRLERARKVLIAAISDPPGALEHAARVGLDAGELSRAWSAWRDARGAPGASIADRAEERYLELDAAAAELRARAGGQLKLREDAWRPLARALDDWLPCARRLLREAETVEHLKAAEEWVRDTMTTLHNERFEPIKTRVKQLWDLLRTQSSVDLYDITFSGRATRRRIELGVKVDGSEGVALGVMSQGELNSLALCLFLPRATLEASPFRFVMIDDPVQAMDPSKVEGLARVLELVARERQVVVFTHDGRLSQAVRRLGIEADVLEVVRGAGSAVEVRPVRNPVALYLEDARALLREEGLPGSVAARVVPGLCRQSLEAAALEAFWKRALAVGRPHAEIEAEIERHVKLLPRLALALYGDGERAGDVLATLNRKYGARAASAAQACNRGAHGQAPADAGDLINDCEQLTTSLGLLHG